MKNLGFTALNIIVSSNLFVWSVNATIIDGEVLDGTAFDAGGEFIELAPPLENPFGPENSVGDNTFQSPNLFGFNEDQNIVLDADLEVDVLVNTSTDGILSAGTTVASHYIFFDPGPRQSIIGTVNFNSDVLAIITSTDTLLGSDFLANTGVNYLNPGFRGLESSDSVTISGEQQIMFDVTASTPGDYVRVLTAFSPVPEPSSIILMGCGVLVLFLQIQRNRSNRDRFELTKIS